MAIKTTTIIDEFKYFIYKQQQLIRRNPNSYNHHTHFTFLPPVWPHWLPMVVTNRQLLSHTQLLLAIIFFLVMSSTNAHSPSHAATLTLSDDLKLLDHSHTTL